MINIPKIKGRMVEKNITQEKLSALIGIDRSTLNRKINNVEGETLTVKEATQISRILEITMPEEYFFCDVVAKTQL